MKQWAHKVEQLNIRCSKCQRIAQRLLRDEPLLYGEKQHIDQAVTAEGEAINRRIRDGVEARYAQHRYKRGGQAA